MNTPHWQRLVYGFLVAGIVLGFWGCTSSPKFRRDKATKPKMRWNLTQEPHQVGQASYYGADFHGRPTSSGEIFDMYALTAAHKTLPLGSIVQVTHLGNHKSVIVKVNDRGPFVEGRIIDLSYGAAQEIQMIVEGVAEVRIDVLRFGGEK